MALYAKTHELLIEHPERVPHQEFDAAESQRACWLFPGVLLSAPSKELPLQPRRP